MTEIVFKNHQLRSPHVTCVLKIYEDSIIVCHLYRTWVDKGEGKLIVSFENHMDFRTMIKIDMDLLLGNILEEIGDIRSVSGIEVHSIQGSWFPESHDKFETEWSLCHEAIHLWDITVPMCGLTVHLMLKE